MILGGGGYFHILVPSTSHNDAWELLDIESIAIIM